MLQKIKIKANGRLEHFEEESLLHLESPYEEEKEKEAQFFFPKKDFLLRVGGKPFTHLKLGIPIEVVSNEGSSLLTIERLEGNGDFSLHLVMGPQMEGDHWILYLKALRRSDQTLLRFRWAPLHSSS